MNAAATLMNKAWEFAIKTHGDQKYGDKPYSYHLEQVVENIMIRKFGDPMLSTCVAVAWLHDVMEDCGVTYKELVDNFGVCIADAVLRLTKHKGVAYNDYMIACCESALAREVKICDTLANLNESFNTFNEKGMKKYPTQLAILVAGSWAGKLVYMKEEE